MFVKHVCDVFTDINFHMFRNILYICFGPCVFHFLNRDANMLHWLLFSVNSVINSNLTMNSCASKRAGVHGVLVLGITVDASLDMFLDTGKGQEYLQKHSIVAMLKNDTTLYVPAGFFQ